MEEYLFVDKDGRTRKGKLVVCKSCNKEFPTRIDQPSDFCSKECSSKNRRNKISLECACCNKKFERSPSKTKHSRSGIQFCSRLCKDKSQRIGGIKEIMPPHYNVSNSKHRNSQFYRRIYKEEHQVENLSCSRCGYCEFECGIDIHHIDKNYKNNDKNNLLPLCAPCHRALHGNLWQID